MSALVRRCYWPRQPDGQQAFLSQVPAPCPISLEFRVTCNKCIFNKLCIVYIYNIQIFSHVNKKTIAHSRNVYLLSMTDLFKS